MSDHLTDEEREWGERLLEQLYDAESAASKAIPQVEAVLNGELTIAEYEEWLDNNDDVLSALQL